MSKSIRDRVAEALDAKIISATDLSKISGVSHSVIVNLKRRPASSTSTENGERLRAALDALDSGASCIAVQPERVEIGEVGPEGYPLVQVYDLRASAGDGAVVDAEDVRCTLAFPPDYLRRITSTNPANLTIISVKGDSMEPTLSDDDIVMLDMSKTSLGYEGLFVIRIYDVLHVKRLSHSRPGHVMVISDNRDRYPPREYSVDEVEVVGKVLWAGGKI